MQQTFLSAYRSMLGGSTPREPVAWLATIARNECWSRARARMREPLAEPDHDGAESAVAPDALSEAIAGHELKTLCRALRRLPRQQREALLLRELSGYTYTEVAQLLAVSESAVDSLLVRARRRLKDVRLGLAAWLPLPASLRSLLAHLFEGGAGPFVAKATAAVAIAVAVTGAAGGSHTAQRVAPSHDPVVPLRMATATPTTAHARVARPRAMTSVRRPRVRRAVSHRRVTVDTPKAAPAPSAAPSTPAHEPTPQPAATPPAPTPSEPASAPEMPVGPATAASGEPETPTDRPAESEPARDSAPATPVTEAVAAAEAPAAAVTETADETVEAAEAGLPVDVPSVASPAVPKVPAPPLPKPLR